MRERHRVAPRVLTGINVLGVPFVARGLVVLDPWLVLFGLAVHMAGKNWLMDRMALLHENVTTGPSDPGRTGGVGDATRAAGETQRMHGAQDP